MIVKHNMTADFTNRQIGINNRAILGNSEKLSSGYRINRAADDAAGLSISEKMRGQIRGLMQAARNVEDGMNLINVQDAGMQEIHSILDRQRELCVQAANDTYAIEDRRMIQDEINTLTKEIDNIAHGTEFNKIRVLDGEMREVQKEIKKVVGVDVGDVTSTSKEIHLVPPDAGENGAMNGLAAVNDDNTLKSTMLYNYGTAGTSGYMLSASDENGRVYTISNVGTMLEGFINGTSVKVTAENFKESDTSNNVKTTYNFYDTDGETVLFSVERNITRVANPYGSGEAYDFSFQIKNKTSNKMTFNIEFGLDIETATSEKGGSFDERNDNPQFLDNLGNLIEKAVQYDKNDIPEYINIFDIHNPYLNIQAIYKDDDDGDNPYRGPINVNPDYVKLGHFSEIWGSGFKDGMDITNIDTMYSVGWNNIEVNGIADDGTETESKIYNTMYGVSDPEGNSMLKDVEPKKETVTTSITVMQATELNIQCGANTGQLIQLFIYDCKSAALGLLDIPVLDAQSATESISILDHAQEIISSYRSDEGARYNRLTHAYNADLLTAENLQSSESRIRDANMADEMVQYSSKSIIQQAAQSMLAQANDSPEGVLLLLG